MAHGGIYDQLGGGFHRYTVDANWLTPHFEKMLYDNAQLVRLYLHVFQVTRDPFFERIARETMDYVIREMTDPKGGFYSSQDADSEGVEGKFFVWSPEEVFEIIGEREARIFCRYFDVTPEGNFEGKSILNIKKSFPEVCLEFSIDEEELERVLTESKKKLFAEREERVKPHRDEKVLTAWNGLMLAAFAEAGAILDDGDYIAAAEASADFILSELIRDGRLLRSWKDGTAKLNAYIEDYANLADGLIELYQATGKAKYLLSARELADKMISEFWDEEGGGFYFTSSDHEALIVRSKDFNDNATPSGNSAAADVLLRLSKIFGEEKYERHALSVMRMIAPQIDRYAGAFGRALSAMEFLLGPVREIVVTGAMSEEIEEVLRLEYMPRKVLVRESDGGPDLPLLEGRSAPDGKTAVYVCENFTCKFPVSDAESLRVQLGVK